MIRQTLTRSQIAVFQVVAAYQIGGTPELDLIDRNGRLFEGCSLLSLGGGFQDLLTIPEKGAEVLVLLNEGGSPYVLGALADQRRFVDEPQITNAGEYSEQTVALRDSALLAGEARVVVSNSQSAVYLSPRVRIQGKLELTDGEPPQQSVAVAEPLLETLSELRGTLEAVRGVVNLIGPYVQGLMVAAGNPQAAELGLALLQIGSETPVARDTIASAIAKIER